MKILSSEQIRACDEYTIQNEGITSLDLMERAADQCAGWILKNCPTDSSFHVVCGLGNNGGDGFALSRLLLEAGHEVIIYALDSGKSRSPDCWTNLDILLSKFSENVFIISEQDVEIGGNGLVKEGASFGDGSSEESTSVKKYHPEGQNTTGTTFFRTISPNDIIIDAIFGTGLNRAVEGWMSDVINQINPLPNVKIAIDVPSGLMTDSLPNPQDHTDPSIVRADHTLSFQFHKRAFLHPEGGIYSGKVQLLDIQMSKSFIENAHTDYHTVDAGTVSAMSKPGSAFAHKGTFGTTLIIAGSHGMMGAAVLSARAALRSGVGKVCGWVPECGYEIFQMGVPEATCFVGGEKHLSGNLLSEQGREKRNTNMSDWGNGFDIRRFQSVGIGPGIGHHPETVAALSGLLQSIQIPLVLDADALNIIASDPELMTNIPRGSIITPHPGEFKRLFGSTDNSFEMVDLARKEARERGIYIILKGRHTIVACPDGQCHYNLTGNPGMATGGSGDVLTGLLAGLLAQGYSARDASLIGVYIHGLAGDIAAEKHGQQGLIAGDIIESLGNAWKTI